MAREKARGGREKTEWEKRFYGKVNTEMGIYNLDNEEVGKVLGICGDTFSIKVNDPKKLKLWEFCKRCDFLHLDRGEIINLVCPKGEKKR